MQTFSIWQEGAQFTGGGFPAELVGTIEVSDLSDFKDACKLFHVDSPNCTYSPHTNTIWGCKLFDNEIDARKGFG